jgi:ribonuclease P protein component
MKSYTFNKAERLCSKTLIDNLFSKGNSVVSQFPFRILWQAVHEPSWSYPAQVMVSVSKKNFPAAVNRNRIKRQMRELYRLKKHHLYAQLLKNEMQVVLSVTFQGKEQLEHHVLKSAFDKIMNKLTGQLDQYKKANKAQDETPA